MRAAMLWTLVCGMLGALSMAMANASDVDTVFAPTTPLLIAQESMDDLFEGSAAAKPAPTTPSKPAAAPVNPATKPAESAPTAQKSATDAGSMDDLFDKATPEPATPAKPATTPEAIVAPSVAKAEPKSSIKVSGFVQNELAYTYAGREHFSKFKTLSKVRINGRFNDDVSWQVGGHLQYDPIYELNDFYPRRVEHDQKLDGYLDETFVDIDAGAWDIRLGRQHIVWGEMVGLFFADVVSALDLREFVLPDFDLIRIPQWAARAEYYHDDFHLEFIYIPYMTIDDLGKFGSEFFPFQIQLPPGVQAVFRNDRTPDDLGSDMGAGTRASYLKDGWDVSLFYYTSPDKTAAFQRQIDLGPIPTLTFKPIHDRIHQIGSTVAKDFGSFVFKAEAIETANRLISVTDLADPDGLARSNELRYVLGVDWAGETGHNANFQFFQTWLQEHKPTMISKEVETGASIFLTTTSWHHDIKPEVLWIRSLDRNEWLLETKVTWNFATNWRGVLGADIFDGPPTGVLGQFDSTDRVYWEFRYSF
ncbi:MAG: hypothetical protein HYX63_00680 [Gammaproteobacteria bacterium]|nr:hypothetical protein [Gammaproteobacteria bacterium]